jgi:hypothetical protein
VDNEADDAGNQFGYAAHVKKEDKIQGGMM